MVAINKLLDLLAKKKIILLKSWIRGRNIEETIRQLNVVINTLRHKKSNNIFVLNVKWQCWPIKEQ